MSEIVFFNISWMDKYQGPASNLAVGGGSYVDEHGFGMEAFNFQPYQGKMYGFVEVGWHAGRQIDCLNIEKLKAGIHDMRVFVDFVIWTARKPDLPETAIIGWYKNATVYRERQKPPSGSNRTLPDNQLAYYFAVANEHDCFCVPPQSRDFLIPRAYQGSGIGQKNVYYGGTPREKLQWLLEIKRYIAKWQP